MKFRIFKYEKVTSTNDVAMNLIKNGKKKIGYVYAISQAKGRGTYGKKWISKEGNLYGSIFFPLKNNFPPFNEFSIVNPVIITDVISFFCKGQNINFKWPNDVLVNRKKICGILQEVVTIKNEKFLIVGIGINIISSPNIKLKYKATNIFLETNKKPNIDKIVNKIILGYENFFSNLRSYNYNYFKNKVNLITNY